MASWVLVPSLETLRAEFNTLSPGRDKASDGTIGDPAHADRSSDHNPDETGNTPDEDSDSVNEVHGLDVDDDLKLSNLTMEDCVQKILKRCRKDNSDPDNEPRLKYIIFNKRIWEAPNWNQQAYTGSNPHDKHAHFSAEYDSQYSQDTSPWGLIEESGDDMPSAEEIADAVWNRVMGTSSTAKRWPDTPNQKAMSYLMLAAVHAKDGANADSAEVARDAELAADVDAIAADVDAIAAAIVGQLPPNTVTYDVVKSAVSEVLLHGAAPEA